MKIYLCNFISIKYHLQQNKFKKLKYLFLIFLQPVLLVCMYLYVIIQDYKFAIFKIGFKKYYNMSLQLLCFKKIYQPAIEEMT